MTKQKRIYGAEVKRRNIGITDEDYAALREFGNGNASAGIRALIKQQSSK
mgnify:CR=1 FL=1